MFYNIFHHLFRFSSDLLYKSGPEIFLDTYTVLYSDIGLLCYDEGDGLEEEKDAADDDNDDDDGDED